MILTSDTRDGEARQTKGLPHLAKVASGVPGFDEITEGGLPRGRTTLLCGAAGAGKTLFGMQFLVNGILRHDEPGVFIAFEETEDDLGKNVASLGFDLQQLVASQRLYIDHFRVERSEIEENGAYNLDGLFIRLNLAIQAVGAKRLVIDTLETLFGGLDNHAVLRSEIRRLFRWLSEQGVSAIVTAERGDGALTRHGLEEYVSDCVILLDHRVQEQISTRRLRVVKYRGTTHGTNEYPFLIGTDGITVMPITSAGLQHAVSDERVSSGIASLDAMLGGPGYYRGSTILVSGTAGAGKTSLAAHFADGVCRGGDRCLYFSFEESPEQIIRNMRSIGVDLAQHRDTGLLEFVAARPTSHGLETHLAVMHKAINGFSPAAVVVDPVGNFIKAGNENEAHLMVVRLVDLLKMHNITAVLTNLTGGGQAQEETDIAVSSIVDTWLLVRNIEANGERNRSLYVLKSRGMAHSNQVREFVISPGGVELIKAYIGPEGVLVGSARQLQESKERAARLAREQDIERQRLELERKRAAMELQIRALQREFEAQEAELAQLLMQEQASEELLRQERSAMAESRDSLVRNK